MDLNANSLTDQGSLRVCPVFGVSIHRTINSTEYLAFYLPKAGLWDVGELRRLSWDIF